MAVGDVVNAILTQVANYSNYQPAVGIEVIVLSSSSDFNTNLILYNGVISASNQAVNTAGSSNNIKFCINNTNYLRIYNETTYAQFSGMQIK